MATEERGPLRVVRSVLVTGGARSGKSAFAEQLTLKLGTPALYIATTALQEASDDPEMTARIAAHRARRGAEWQTVEEPLALAEALARTDGYAPRLVDCLTMWVANLIFAGHDWQKETERLLATLPRLNAPVVFVTSEVGWSIVPENALARVFRDALGLVNQRVAAACAEVWLCVAGCPMKLK